MTIKQITESISFQSSANDKAVATLPFVPLINWAITVDVNGVSDDPQFALEIAEQTIVANKNIIGESVVVTFWAAFDASGNPTGESVGDYDLVDRDAVQSMINDTLTPAQMGINQTVSKTIFVTVRTETQNIVTNETVEPEVDIQYQIIHVPAFWPELSTQTEGSGQSVGTIDNLPEIQAALKADGERFGELGYAH